MSDTTTYRVVVVCPDCGRSHVEISQREVKAGFAIERVCIRCQDMERSATGDDSPGRSWTA